MRYDFKSPYKKCMESKAVIGVTEASVVMDRFVEGLGNLAARSRSIWMR